MPPATDGALPVIGTHVRRERLAQWSRGLGRSDLSARLSRTWTKSWCSTPHLKETYSSFS